MASAIANPGELSLRTGTGDLEVFEEDQFFAGLAAKELDFPETYKGETLETPPRFTSSCCLVEFGIVEIRSIRGIIKLLKNRPILNVDQIFGRAGPTC